MRHHFNWPLSLDAVWLAGPLFLVAFAALLSPVRPFDYFWALVQGRACVQLAAIPSQNLFLFTLPAHTPFFDQPWLAQLTMFGAYTLGGHAANVVLLAACLVLAFALSLDTAVRLGASARAAALVALFAVPLVVLGAGVRTQMFAYPCFAATLRSAVLDPGRFDVKRAGVSVVVAALWANLHGSFVLAPLLMAAPVAVSLFETARKRAWHGELFGRSLGFFAVSIGTLLNPSGPWVYLYVARLGRAMNVAGSTDVAEWQAPSLSSSSGVLFAALLAAGFGLLLTLRRRSLPSATLLFLALGLLSLSSQRFAGWWALTAIVALASLFPAVTASSARGSALVNLAFIATPGALLLLSLPGLPLFERAAQAGHLPYAEARVLSSETPLRIGEALARSGYQGRLFHDQALGGFIEWMLARDAPRPVAFVDQRFELTPPALWRDYFAIASASAGWQLLLQRHAIDALLVHEERSARLVAALTHDARWLLHARELGYSLFVLKR